LVLVEDHVGPLQEVEAHLGVESGRWARVGQLVVLRDC
jgi:hypothetical protein